MKLIHKRLKVRTVTGTDTATTNDDVLLLNDASGAFIETLPPAANCVNKVIYLKKINSSSNNITIDGNGSETIDGATTTNLVKQYDSVTIVSDGSNWHIIDRFHAQIARTTTRTFDVVDEDTTTSHPIVVSANPSSHGLMIVRGTSIGGNGEGFGITTTAAGSYTLTFNTAFADTPMITASHRGAAGPAGYIAVPYQITTTGFKVTIFDIATHATGSSVDFDFIAIGQRGG